MLIKRLVILIVLLPFCAIGNQQEMHPTKIPILALDRSCGKLNKQKAIAQFKKEISLAQKENKKIPHKDNSIFRIVSYNVHFWKNPEKTKTTMDRMIAVLKTLNPDVIILQEVSGEAGFMKGFRFTNSTAMNALKCQLGMQDFAACNTLFHSWFGNVVASKTPFFKQGRYYFKKQYQITEKRCNVFAQLSVLNKNMVSVYGTHLEVNGDESLRTAQIKEIANYILDNLNQKNVLIAGDFNATRKTSTVEDLQKLGFKDCFTYMGWQHPHYTNWTGKEIDFIFLSPNWNLPLAGCYVYYDDASDHLPIIMDIKMG